MTQRKSYRRQTSVSAAKEDPVGPFDGSEPFFHGISLPVLLLGNDLRLRRFTKQAAEMFQLKSSDMGSRISMLKLKIPGLSKFAGEVIQKRNFLETEVHRQDGHWYLLRIEPHLTGEGLLDGALILLLNIDRSKRTEIELEKLNETLQALFQSAPDAIVTVDAWGRIMRIISQTEIMFGYMSADLHGKKIEVLMPACFKTRHLRQRPDYLADPQLRLMSAGLDLYGKRKDGTEFPVDVMLSPIETPDGRSIIATIRDITNRKRAEAELRKSGEEQVLSVERTTAVVALETRSRQQKAISDLSQHALEGLDLTTLLEDAVSLVRQILGVEFCKMLELSTDRTSLLLRAGAGWKVGNVGKVALAAGPKSQAGFALLSKSPVIAGDLRTEKRFHGSPLLLDHGAVSGVSVIIHGRARPYGVLEAHPWRTSWPRRLNVEAWRKSY
jgi:PAS domain S-box-containing protein